MQEPPTGHGYIDVVGNETHFWRIETLWAAAEGLPSRNLPLEEIPWQDDGCFILGDPPTWGAFAVHVRRAMDADLTYPIIVGPNGDVMDGMHRVVRAFVEGRDHVHGVVLTDVPPPDRITPRPPNDTDASD